MECKLLALLISLWAAPICAQQFPAPTLPLAGTEVIPCIQPPPGHANSGYKACTAANIADTQGGGALLKDNNLSDVVSPSASLVNIGGASLAANNIFDGTNLFSGSMIGGPNWTYSPSGTGGTPTGNAQFLFTPSMDSAIHQQALFVFPVVGSFTNPSGFAGAYNMKWGDSGSEVPAGTQVNFGAFECNITTMQALADMSEGNHCFGGTIQTDNGGEEQGIAIVAHINNVAATYYGADIAVDNRVAGGSQYGFEANSIGTHAALSAFHVDGPWTHAFDGNALPMVNTNLQSTGWNYIGSALTQFPDITVSSGGAGSLGWNQTLGSGEFDITNNDTTAALSFLYCQMTGASTCQSELQMSTTRALFGEPVIAMGQVYPGNGTTTQTNGGMLAGTGNPGSGIGNNGDFYFRTDCTHGSSDCTWHKESGAWFDLN